jgi:aspartate-semialdehyde dehydrogenase
MEVLSQQSVKLMQGRGFDRDESPEQLAFNVRPRAAALDGEGWSVDERRIAGDLAALLGDPAPDVVATVVRVPVFAGVAQSVYVELERPLGRDEALQLLREGRGILLPETFDAPAAADGEAFDDEGDDGFVAEEQDEAYDLLHDESPGPVEVNGSDAVHVARLHLDPREPRALAFWIAFDELRKGTSLTLVAMLEIALRELR